MQGLGFGGQGIQGIHAKLDTGLSRFQGRYSKNQVTEDVAQRLGFQLSTCGRPKDYTACNLLTAYCPHKPSTWALQTASTKFSQPASMLSYSPLEPPKPGN